MPYAKTLFDTNFLEYASYVIKDRAIPHIDDGLKPVQRRILHSLLEMDDGRFNKVANVVGHCMKYHPHGDASIYSALVVLANKDLFIEKQGNFGNLYTGDDPSAARYIECRLLPFAKNVLYNPEITDFIDSYDGRNKEPIAFPAKIPVLLVQGAEGIAVGMSTRILPHNLIEVLEAVKSCLKGKSFQLLPDFPTGGFIDAADYEDGIGKVRVRARLEISKDKKKITILEIPYGSTTESIINSIESASRKGKIKVAEINDYTSEKVEIEVKLARGVYAEEVVDSLYAFTECEQSISVNLLVIYGRVPAIMTVTEVIEYHAKQLVAILKKELELERGHLNDRLHARTLERIFVEERIYKDIEKKDTQEKVSKAVIDGFVPFHDQIKRDVTEEDVERLLRIPIRRISLFDINKARKEMDEMRERLKQITFHLKHLIDYATGFLDGIIEDKSKDFARKSELISFDRVDVREVAQRNLELRYNSASGYLGHGMRDGKVLFPVSHYDRVLVIRRTGEYSVIDAPEKLYVGKGLLSCGLADKEKLTETIITLIYRDKKTGYAYLKRCKIEQFILEKVYSLVPDEATVLKLTTRTGVDLIVSYKPKPRLKVLEESFVVDDYLIKSVKANGVRLSTKEVRSAKFETSKQPAAKTSSKNGKNGSAKKK
ncbi:MAG: DNA topoisomerase IV subunit A [Spirochaetales bacterium]|jgi:topoisomerase IV subunit A|nr:DNA topoisomerase IV subunit A [Spirochaetales bacterium]